jgi:deoxycytidylate deaminase
MDGPATWVFTTGVGMDALAHTCFSRSVCSSTRVGCLLTRSWRSATQCWTESPRATTREQSASIT